MADALDPKPVTACTGCPQLEASGGTGDGSGLLLPAIIEQDDERFQQRCAVGLTHGAADHLLGRQPLTAEEQGENSDCTADALHSHSESKLHVVGKDGVRAGDE